MLESTVVHVLWLRENAGGCITLSLLGTVVVGRRVCSQEELARAINHGIEQGPSVMRKLLLPAYVRPDMEKSDPVFPSWRSKVGRESSDGKK